jgi:flavin-dependent dehydrogenase
MLSGKLAGETAVKSNEYDDLHILKEYDKKWKNERYDSYQYELYTAKEMLLSMSISSRAELSEKLWLTAARDCAYPFRASNVMKQRNAQLQYLKVLVGDNRLRKWALEQSLKILQEKLKFCWI